MDVWKFNAIRLFYLTLTFGMAMAIPCKSQKINPVPVIFETDMGNDVDDGLALAMLFRYADQGKINLLGISNNKQSLSSLQFIDLMRKQYNYNQLPIATVRDGVQGEDEARSFARKVMDYREKGKLIYSSNIKRYGDAEDAISFYRRMLAGSKDTSVVIISVGFSTNLAKLLGSKPDRYSKLSGLALVKRKVKFLSTMAGNFSRPVQKEFNVISDLPAARKLFSNWPTAIYISPFEVGASVHFPASAIEANLGYSGHQPLVRAYREYITMPYNRETWDLSAVLFAVEKQAQYFKQSMPGKLLVDEQGYTTFKVEKNGNHYFLHTPDQSKGTKIKDRYVELIMAPDSRLYGIRNSMLYKDFLAPPDSVRPYVYWYWINDHISAPGVVKDLEAMKKVGIGGAFIGNIGLSKEEGTSYGNVKLFSEGWWKATEAAMETAAKNGITLGMFNSPGWSQSGGPWIKPASSMRYVTSSNHLVKGGKTFSMNVLSGHVDTSHLFTLAVPAPAYADFNISTYQPQLSTDGGNSDVSSLMDGNLKTVAMLKPNTKNCYIDVNLNKSLTARSLVLHPAEIPFSADVLLQIWRNGKMETIKNFQINRINPSKQVGFIPFAPLSIAFDAVASTKFRIVLQNIEGDPGFKEISLSPAVFLERYMEKQLAKMYATPLPLWPEYQWQTQHEDGDLQSVIDPEKVINLKSFINAQGVLKWKVPAGKWLILNYSLAPTGVTNSPASPEGRGLEVDKMNREKLQLHFDSFIGKVLERIPEEKRSTFKYLVADSYEMGSQNWTDSLQHVFKQVYGYDPLPWLPVLTGNVVGSADQSDRFLWDLRRLVADLVATEYVGGIKSLGNKSGLKLWLENYGHWGFPSEFLKYGGASDEVAGEFWNEGELGNIENKSASSAAHIYGKRRVWAESFTAGGGAYSRYPGLLKKRGDWSFTEGVNQTLLHLYIHQPDESAYPGVNAWFSTEFNRKNTWFDQGKAFIDYLRRCNYLLQQGNPVNDIAYFIGEDAPKMTGIRDPELPEGYSYDYINAEVILNRLSVKEGKLLLPEGVQYKILVLPPLKTMRPLLLEKIASLVRDGAVVLGPIPEKSPSLADYPKADQQVKTLAGELWGGQVLKKGIRKYGKGLVMEGISLQNALDYIGVTPDFKTDAGDKVRYTHRSTEDQEIYFVTNQSGNEIEFSGTFRIADAAPYWWDPVTGSMRDLPDFKMLDGKVSIPFKLETNQSGFVVFNKGELKSVMEQRANFPVSQQLVRLTAPWQVHFLHTNASGGPEKTVVFNRLISWPEHSDERIQKFSGTAVYSSSFNMTKLYPTETIFLNTGPIHGMAKVTVNGKELGTVWTAPWQVDISAAVKKGENKVEIAVVNTWTNRLIGDSKLDVKDRLTRTDVTNIPADNKYEPSGLIGPVNVTKVQY